jgi:hypothetical protein
MRCLIVTKKGPPQRLGKSKRCGRAERARARALGPERGSQQGIRRNSGGDEAARAQWRAFSDAHEKFT